MNVLNETNFDDEVLKSAVPVLIDFFATWCMPCKMVAPVLEEISSEMSGSVKIYKVDIDESPNLASKYKIRAVPTMMVFKGGQPVSTMTGAQPKPKIIDEINKHV